MSFIHLRIFLSLLLQIYFPILFVLSMWDYNYMYVSIFPNFSFISHTLSYIIHYFLSLCSILNIFTYLILSLLFSVLLYLTFNLLFILYIEFFIVLKYFYPWCFILLYLMVSWKFSTFSNVFFYILN